MDRLPGIDDDNSDLNIVPVSDLELDLNVLTPDQDEDDIFIKPKKDEKPDDKEDVPVCETVPVEPVPVEPEPVPVETPKPKFKKLGTPRGRPITVPDIVTCECGVTMKKKSLCLHKRSKHHKAFMKAKEEGIELPKTEPLEHKPKPQVNHVRPATASLGYDEFHSYMEKYEDHKKKKEDEEKERERKYFEKFRKQQEEERKAQEQQQAQVKTTKRILTEQPQPTYGKYESYF